MRILLVFIDGIGIGPDDPDVNPFSVANMPTLIGLTNGQRWVEGIGEQRNNRALFKTLDPRMGVQGRPQSGSNHATIITGKPIPQIIGEHYGPKPNAQTREIVAQGT
ncbi:MAG: peptidase, partial [Chloroflexota bacterium]